MLDVTGQQEMFFSFLGLSFPECQVRGWARWALPTLSVKAQNSGGLMVVKLQTRKSASRLTYFLLVTAPWGT